MIKHYVTTMIYINDKSYRSDIVIEEYDIHEYIRRELDGNNREKIYMEFNAPVNGKLYARSWEYVGNDEWTDEEKRLLDINKIPYYEYTNGVITEKNFPLKSK